MDTVRIDTDPTAQHFRVELFKKLITRYPCKSLLDIACGHCLFSIAAAELGTKVTAVDARRERVPAGIERLGIQFIQQDVNAPDFTVGNYDVILLFGLLYHLTIDEQARLLRKCAHSLTLIDTHTSDKIEARINGYEGRYYIEDEEKRKDPRSAYTSTASFWHTKDSLQKLLRASGYRSVTLVEPETAPERNVYICEPTSSQTASPT